MRPDQARLKAVSPIPSSNSLPGSSPNLLGSKGWLQVTPSRFIPLSKGG